MSINVIPTLIIVLFFHFRVLQSLLLTEEVIQPPFLLLYDETQFGKMIETLIINPVKTGRNMDQPAGHCNNSGIHHIHLKIV